METENSLQYDRDYLESQNLFGDPYPDLTDFVQRLAQSLEDTPKALDVGCGQGRNSLMMAKAGFQVTAVDHSSVGVRQLREKAGKLKRLIDAHCINLFDFTTEEPRDLIILDAMLHFTPESFEEDMKKLQQFPRFLKPAGILAVTLHPSSQRERILFQELTIQQNFTVLEQHKVTGLYTEAGERTPYPMWLYFFQKRISLI